MDGHNKRFSYLAQRLIILNICFVHNIFANKTYIPGRWPGGAGRGSRLWTGCLLGCGSIWKIIQRGQGQGQGQDQDQDQGQDQGQGQGQGQGIPNTALNNIQSYTISRRLFGQIIGRIAGSLISGEIRILFNPTKNIVCFK